MAMQFAARFPLSVNNTYRAWQGRVILCPKAKEYKALVARDVRQMGLPGFGGVALRVHYVIHAPDHHKRDLANLDKLLTDALVDGGLFHDDSQIDDHRFTRGPVDTVNPRIEVFIEPMEKQLEAFGGDYVLA